MHQRRCVHNCCIDGEGRGHGPLRLNVPSFPILPEMRIISTRLSQDRPSQFVWIYQVCPTSSPTSRSNSPPGCDQFSAQQLHLPECPSWRSDEMTATLQPLPKGSWCHVPTAHPGQLISLLYHIKPALIIQLLFIYHTSVIHGCSTWAQ